MVDIAECIVLGCVICHCKIIHHFIEGFEDILVCCGTSSVCYFVNCVYVGFVKYFKLFLVSFAAVIVQDFNAFVLSDWKSVWGNSALFLPSVVVIVCIVEIWYTRLAKGKGWLT